MSGFRISVILPLLLLLQACGFHLRGPLELPPVLEVPYIQSDRPYQGISKVLRQQLRLAGAETTDDLARATGVLNVVAERSQRRILSVGSTGRATEYELFEEVTFSVSDKEGNQLMRPQSVSMVRSLTFDENELLGKVSEAEKVQGEMRQDLSRQILTRISVAGLKL